MAPPPVRVLIADDDYLVSLLVEEELQAVGAVVVGHAHNGREAVELTCSLRPDAVVMDVEMPIMGGVEAAKQIRELRPTPVVLLTAHGSRDAAALAEAAGASAYLTKPADGAQLLKVILAALARFEA